MWISFGMELKDNRELAMKSVRILHVLYYRNKKVWRDFWSAAA